ncbi:aminoglycoside phosphotransferase family protein [Phaeobacter sp.]|uniref:aminoglycoside phosphotransferase family protein n=1 Tax=Phaeobacter sp. TaxID=1902409 RepID=UPI0025F22016|nr:aminoglycoside phosphotransferase family protein [Phaeobacter sp.]
MTSQHACSIPQRLVDRFAITTASLVFRSNAARVWRVRLASGECAALKLYADPRMGNEAAGWQYIARAGALTVDIMDQTGGAILMGWLDGPSLGDLAREGAPEQADRVLADMAQQLTAAAISPADLLPLSQLLAPLERMQTKERALAEALTIYRYMQSHMQNSAGSYAGLNTALHGDLHHDNIRSHAGRWRAFDAKGLQGPAAYELANAFRHPRGMTTYASQPATIMRRLDLWSAALDVSRTDLAQWGAVKIALSCAWRGKSDPFDLRVLDQLLGHA